MYKYKKWPTRGIACRLFTASLFQLGALHVANAAPSVATYLGGSGPDLAKAVALDAAEHIYVASTTASGNFPGLRPSDYASYRYKGSFRCVVTVLDSTGGHALKSFALPPPGVSTGIRIKPSASAGSWNDGDCNPTAIRVDSLGNIYVAGSTGLVATAGDPNHLTASLPGAMMGFVTKLDASGAVVYSTLVGGYSEPETGKPASYDNEKSKTFPTSLVVDTSGNAVIGGWTTSSSLAGVAGRMQSSLRSSGVGGFVTTLDPSGAITAATFLGESAPISLSSNSTTQVNDVTLNAGGDIVIAGSSDSTNMQITSDAFDKAVDGVTHGFLLIASRDLKTLIYGTAVTGQRTAQCVASLPDELAFQKRPLLTETSSVTISATDDIYIAGTTTSTCLPITANAWQGAPRALESTYVLRMNSKRVVDFVSYFDLAAGTTGAPKLALTGSSASTAMLVMSHNAMGAKPESWPAYRPSTAVPNIGTSNVFVEQFRVALDGSASSVERVESFGASAAVSMLSTALSPDGNVLALVGTTKAGDLPVASSALSATNQGDRDGFVATFDTH